MTDNKPNTIEFDPKQYPYRIRNWSKFQHYKKRNPPWVKIHNSIFLSDDWASIPDNSKLIMVICIVVASRFDGFLPKSLGFIQRCASLRRKVNLKPLIECGFLVETQANASIVLADARPEDREQRTEDRAETDKKVSIGQPLVDPTNVPQETKKKGTTDGYRGTRLPDGWLPSSEVHLFAVGVLGEAGAAEQLDRFRDYWLSKAGAAARKTDWGRTFRNWCRTAKERKGNGYSRPQTLKERTADALQRLGSGSFSEIIDNGLPKLGPN